MDKKREIEGIVTSRKCPSCGHHEIGIITSEGKFHPLRLGTYVKISESKAQDSKKLDSADEKKSASHKIPWVPEEIRKNKRLRLKYGVLIQPEEGEVDIRKYKILYINKLQSLIEKEIYPNIIILLDTYFQSPHLASGNPSEVTINLLRDIDDVRRPIELMEAYLKNKTEENLKNLISPLTIEDLKEGEFISDEQFTKELEELTFEEFLKIL